MGKITINENDLAMTKEFAHANYLELAPSPDMDSNTYNMYCQFEAVCTMLMSKGAKLDIEYKFGREKPR